MGKVFIGDHKVNQVVIGDEYPLALIGGPCAIESEEHSLYMADQINQICQRLNVPYIFKSCYDKDCRSSIHSFIGVGMEEGLPILQKVRETIGVPVTADFSEATRAAPTAEVVDLLQVPAYLCRQTHILMAAGETGKPVNIKKGQFMDPRNMRQSVEKVTAAGNPHEVIVTERGTFMGYDDLVNDLRGLQIMREQCQIVCYDATHSIQRPTGSGNISGGQREFIPGLVRAAAASGIDVLFMEIHDDPDNALSDPATQIPLKYVEKVLAEAKAISELRRELLSKWGEDDVK